MFTFARRPQPASQVYCLADAKIVELDDTDHLKELLIHDKTVPFVAFSEIAQYLSEGYNYKLESELDHFCDHNNRIISLSKDQDLKLAEVQYNSANNKIYPPK